jgi:transposase
MVVIRNHQQRSIPGVYNSGLDLAKNVFQVHAVDDMGSVMYAQAAGPDISLLGFRHASSASKPAHHWAGGLIARGHEARLMQSNQVERLRETQQA